MSESSVKTDDRLLNSANDNLIYKNIVLKNGLKALLVSDPTFQCTEDELIDVSSIGTDSDSQLRDKSLEKSVFNENLSAMAVVVRTGSFCDPREVQGLAHLVEHVITMGSQEFPEENGLNEYLSSRGGYQNARTEYEYTLYEIEVQRKHFYGALQRLSHCFIDPLLKADSIEREIKPVDTEFMEAMNNDEVRIEQIICSLANEDHPLCTFPWGNTLSLKEIPEQNGTDIQKCVKEFIDKHYSSDNIHVVIQSQETIETLEEWVTELFTKLKTSKQISTEEKFEFGNPFMNNQNFNKLYLIEALHEVNQLTILWCLPSIVNQFKKCPLDYLGYIIEHEGKGSLISFLRKENLALQLAGGLEESGFANNRYFSMFLIRITLTELGHKDIDLVIEYVFEYLKLLHSMKPQKWFFNELKNMEENRFNWRQQQSAIDVVRKVALNMNSLPFKYILRGNKLYEEFDEELIQNYLNYLTPTNACFIRLSSEIFKGDEHKDIQTEKWFGTRFKSMEVPQKWLSVQSRLPDNRSSRFHFPEPNLFIAKEFRIKNVTEKNPSLYPTNILDKSRLKVWHKFDHKFKLPKAIIKLRLVSPLINETPENTVMTDLLVELLDQKLSEDTWTATLAGLNWCLKRSVWALVLTISGFNDKIDILLETIISKMIGFEFEDNEFNDMKKNLWEAYHNSVIEPSTLCMSLLRTVVNSRFFNFLDRRTALQSVDQNKLKMFVKTLFRDFYVVALIQGNITKEESIDLITRTELKFGLNSQPGSLEEPHLMTAQIPVGEHYCRVKSLSAKNDMSSTTNYYQLCPADIHLQCMVSVLTSIMEEPCFNTLRTNEGLGYYVSVNHYDINGISGYAVSVNSSGNEFDSTFVEHRIENFLKLMVEYIQNMKEETFKDHITSIITFKRSPDLQLSEEFTRNWSEIIDSKYCFNRLEKEIKCLEKVTFNEFKEWSCDQVLKEQKKRKLTIQIIGNGTKSMAECLKFDGKGLIEENQVNDCPQSVNDFKLIYLKPKTTENCEKYFIEDIYEFKKSLKLFPVHKVID